MSLAPEATVHETGARDDGAARSWTPALPQPRPFQAHPHWGSSLALFELPRELAGPLWLPAGRGVLQRLRDWLHALHAQAGYVALEAAGDDPALGLDLAFARVRRSHHDLPFRRYQLGRTPHASTPGGGLLGLVHVERDEGLTLVEPETLANHLRALLALQLAAGEALGLELDAELLRGRGDDAPLRAAATDADLAVRETLGAAPSSGPRLQLRGRDRFGRRWDLGWLALDLVHAPRYATADDGRAAARTIRHSLLGPLEPLLALLLEQGQGSLPAWLSPVQACVLPVGAGQDAYAARVVQTLRQAGLRVESRRQGPLASRVREAHAEGVPWQVVVGPREQAAAAVSLRGRGPQPARVLALASLPQALTTHLPLTRGEHPSPATVAGWSSEAPQGGYRH